MINLDKEKKIIEPNEESAEKMIQKLMKKLISPYIESLKEDYVNRIHVLEESIQSMKNQISDMEKGLSETNYRVAGLQGERFDRDQLYTEKIERRINTFSDEAIICEKFDIMFRNSSALCRILYWENHDMLRIIHMFWNLSVPEPTWESFMEYLAIKGEKFHITESMEAEAKKKFNDIVNLLILFFNTNAEGKFKIEFKEDKCGTKNKPLLYINGKQVHNDFEY